MNVVSKGFCITQLPKGTDAIRRFFEGDDEPKYLTKLDDIGAINIIVGKNIKAIDCLLREAEQQHYKVYIFPENGLHYTEKEELVKKIIEESGNLKGVFVRTHDYELIDYFNKWIGPDKSSFLTDGLTLRLYRIAKKEAS